MSSLIESGILEPPRACDRCHSIKERCEWVPGGTQCLRCLRLEHVCETTRPRGRPGRKPRIRDNWPSPEPRRRTVDGQVSTNRRTSSSRVSRRRTSVCIAAMPNRLSGLSTMSTDHQRLVQRFLFQDEVLNAFSVGSSFSERVRQQVIPRLLLSERTLLNGLMACALSWTGEVDCGTNQSCLRACYHYASLALGTLTSIQVTDSRTMTDCLMLGALVSTFAVRLRLNDIMAICGQTMGLIEPVYRVSDPALPEVLVFLSCMVMWELRGCLFSCTVPTLRFRSPNEAYADRHVGLCSTLLPLLYDICELSHVISRSGGLGGVDTLAQLEATEQTVQQWQPTVPKDFIVRFTAIEVAHMLCQVQVMRSMALLMTHRLRYPFGVNDGPARVLSTTILDQLETTYIVTQQPVRCIDMALLVALVELKAPVRLKWSANSAKFAGFSPQFGQHVQVTIECLWQIIDSRGTISWSNLMTAGPPFLRRSSEF